MNREQCRAGRAILGWSQSKLAQESGLSENVITSFESGYRDPQTGSLRKIRGTLVYAGVIFVDEIDGYGVKLRSSPINAGSFQETRLEPPISSAQARAARAALGVSQPQVASAIGVGLSLLVAFETGARRPHARNLGKIRTGYETMGIRFFHDGDRPAVSISASPILDPSDQNSD